MKQKYFAILLFSSLLILSCSSSKESSDYNNAGQESESVITSSHLKITIPNNWREIDDNYDRLFEIWLVRKDNNAVISFIPIHLDEKITSGDENDKLSMIEKILLAKKERSNTDFEVVKRGSFQSKYLNKTIYYYVGNQFQNSIIYGKNDIFYECLAYFNNKHEYDSTEIEELIKLQQKIVTESSIK